MTSKLIGAVAMIGAIAIAGPALAQVSSSNNGMSNPAPGSPPSLNPTTTINDRTTLHEPEKDQNLNEARGMSVDPNIQRASVTPSSSSSSNSSVMPVASSSGDKMGRPNAREFRDEQRITAQLNNQQLSGAQ